MTQKFFDNFFPRIKIYRTMCFHRGRHWDADAGELDEAHPRRRTSRCGDAHVEPREERQACA